MVNDEKKENGGKKPCNKKSDMNGGMVLQDFCMCAKFVDPDYPIDITSDVQEHLKDIHPSMIIGSGVLGMELFLIKYSYTTKRGNDRKAHKFMFVPQDELPDEPYEKEIMVRIKAEQFFKDYNFNNPWRAISNVEILEVVPYANAQLAIG